MEMQVPDTLTGRLPVIDHDPESGLIDSEQSGDLSDAEHQMPHELFVGIGKVREFLDMPLRNDENVCRRTRRNVFERKYMFVFKNFLRGNLGLCDLTKNAVVHGL